MAELEEAYDRYWKQRKAYQQADRESLDIRLMPERERLARAIRGELDQSRSVDDIQKSLGSKNRNFFYSILNNVPYLSYAKPKPENETTATVPAIDTKSAEPVFPLTYETEWVDDIGERVLITVTDSSTTPPTKTEHLLIRKYWPESNDYTTSADGLPDEFKRMDLDKETRDFYKQILVNLRENR